MNELAKASDRFFNHYRVMQLNVQILGLYLAVDPNSSVKRVESVISGAERIVESLEHVEMAESQDGFPAMPAYAALETLELSSRSNLNA